MIARECRAEGENTAFASAVGKAAGSTPSRAGSYVDNCSASLADHVRKNRLSSQEHALQIHRHHLIPQLFVGIQNGAAWPNCRVINQSINAVILLDCEPNDLVHF